MGVHPNALLGSRYRTIRIGAGSVAYSKGNRVDLEIPNSLLGKAIGLRLTGNLLVGTAIAGKIFPEAPLGLIKEVKLSGDGRRNIVVADAKSLFRMCHFSWGKQPDLVAPLGTVGTKSFSAYFRLDHEAINFFDPSESLFDGRLYKKTLLSILWGTELDIAQVGGGGNTLSIDAANTSLDVLAEQTAEGVNKILFDHVITQSEKNVVATTSLLTEDIPPNGLLAGMLIRCERDPGDGSGPVQVDDLINNISIVSDTSVRHVDKVKWGTLQRDMVLREQMDGGATVGAPIVGYVYLPLCENKSFASVLNVAALNNAKIVFDVTRTSGTESIRITYDWFEPRRNLAEEVRAAA